MRIGILTDILAEDPWSGIGNYTRSLVRVWKREHEVWSLSSCGVKRGADFAGEVRVWWGNWGWRRKIESRVDVVHSPRPHVADYFYTLNKPRVVTIHGAGPFLLSETTLVRPPTDSQRQLRAKQDQVDVFLTVSRSAQSEIMEHYGIPAECIEPVYHGVDPEVFFPPSNKVAVRERVCARWGIPGVYLLHVSNYRPKKNAGRIVAAYRRLWEQGFRDVALVLAGGTYFGFEAVAAEMERPGGGQIVRLGQLHGSELTELYQAAEVFLFPSLHESFGLPALESMACGVPVVASNVFSLPEVTGGAAVRVNPESVEEIATGTAKLLTDSAFYADCRRAGLARSQEFRWDRCAQKHIEAFERAIQQFHAGRGKKN